MPGGVALAPRRLRVAGTFELGLPEFDSTYGFVAIDDAKRMFGKDDIDFIQLRVDDIWAAPEIAARIDGIGEGDYLTEDWADMNQSLFGALSLERKAISLAIALIVMVAALNIVASLILMVMEKHRDIAILKTMGASARSITVIFMLQGVIIGVIGTRVGRVLGRRRGDDRRPLPPGFGGGGYLHGVLHAVHRAADRSDDGRRRRDDDLLRGHPLPVATSGPPRSGASTSI